MREGENDERKKIGRKRKRIGMVRILMMMMVRGKEEENIEMRKVRKNDEKERRVIRKWKKEE